MKRSSILLTVVAMVVVAGLVVAAVLWPGESGPDGEDGAVTANRDHASEADSSSVDDGKYEPLAEPQRPDEVGAEILRAYYPEGRRERTVSQLLLEGTGSSRAWGLQGNYFLRGLGGQTVVWEVAANDGQRVTFHVRIPVSAMALTAAERDYRLRLPVGDPTLRTVLRALSPRTEQIIEAAEIVDPDMSPVIRLLEAWGLQRDEIERLGLKVREAGRSVEGVEATVVYEDGLGVTERIDLEGEHLDEELANRIDLYLRQSNPVLAAYFLYPVRTPPGGQPVTTDVGERWKVPARHVAGLFNLSLDRFVEGEVELRRRPDQGGAVVLEVLGGEIDYRRKAGGGKTDATLRLEPGTRIRLVPIEGRDAYRVDRGALKAEARYVRASTDHWLFEEKLQAKPRFEAEVRSVAVGGGDGGE